jgi:hypothetical protein
LKREQGDGHLFRRADKKRRASYCDGKRCVNTANQANALCQRAKV